MQEAGEDYEKRCRTLLKAYQVWLAEFHKNKEDFPPGSPIFSELEAYLNRSFKDDVKESEVEDFCLVFLYIIQGSFEHDSLDPIHWDIAQLEGNESHVCITSFLFQLDTLYAQPRTQRSLLRIKNALEGLSAIILGYAEKQGFQLEHILEESKQRLARQREGAHQIRDLSLSPSKNSVKPPSTP